MTVLLAMLIPVAVAGERYEVPFRSEYSATEDCDSDDDACFEREMRSWDRQIAREAREQCDPGDRFIRSEVTARYADGGPVAEAIAQCERQDYVAPVYVAPPSTPSPAKAAGNNPPPWFVGGWMRASGGVCIALELGPDGVGKIGIGKGGSCSATLPLRYRTSGTSIVATRNGVDVMFTLDERGSRVLTADGSPMERTGGGSSGASPGAVAPRPAISAPPASPGLEWKSPTLGTMKWIPAGTFSMGSPSTEVGRGDDETQHKVTISKGFWLMEHEVTQEEWQGVMGSNPASRGDGTCMRMGNVAAPAINEPVYCVVWDEILEFTRRVSERDGVTYSLPTEAQWEFAARGGKPGLYGGGTNGNQVAWTSENSSSRTHAVCQKPRNGYGLCDMLGNVAEVSGEAYAAYPAGPVVDPSGSPIGDGRVYRGGSWFDELAQIRVAFRLGPIPGGPGGALGFRLMRASP
jgi:formylglycine-generating enzyme required for sulfatase activity